MEVIEDGNIMDRIPILLQRDFQYYQEKQTVLSEKICQGVVGGRLDFPRNVSFAAVKIVLWLEEEFQIAFNRGSGMFVKIEGENRVGGVVKTSDPEKFVQLAVKSGDFLLEHLHTLAQEALDHADLPVLTATLGAAALLKNTFYYYVQHVEESGNTERHSRLQACYKRYVTMSEAVGERVLDLHNRVLSLYILQDAGGRPIEDQRAVATGTPSVQGWWLYMNGSRKDLWDTVPPRMAQRIFAGMLNETLTILTVRYCQTNTTEITTPLLLNDILNILLCVAQLLPSIGGCGAHVAGLGAGLGAGQRDVRDLHAKCNELFKCMIYRGAELHFLYQVFKEQDKDIQVEDCPYPWYTFVSPNLFDSLENFNVKHTKDLPDKTAIALELLVLLAQPQPSWTLLVKVLMMRECRVARLLLHTGVRNMSVDNARWPANGLWYDTDERKKCDGFLCTADGFCTYRSDGAVDVEYARSVGALTNILATVGSKAELKSTLCYALEISGRDWASCLDKRQVWCDRRPPWLAGILAIVGTALQFVPPILVNAIQSGASMYQTMSLCLSCISRSLDCIPRCFTNAADVIEGTLPSNVSPVGGSVLLQMLVTIIYEELQNWAKKEILKEETVGNGEAHNLNAKQNRAKVKQVRIRTLAASNPSSSVSFDAAHSTPSSIALAIAEALCSIDEDDKHTQEIQTLVAQTKRTFKISDQFGLEDFPEFAVFFEEGSVPASNAERDSDAAILTNQILMTSSGRDSLRVMYDHLQLHSEWIYKELGVQESCDVNIPLNKAPLLYIMFHIGRRPFDQFLRGEWAMPWSKLVSVAAAWSGVEGARVHINRRADVRNVKTHGKCNKQLLELYSIFKAPHEGLL
ncbi:PREDICTED: uncharacterized protein LOC106121150 isoform X1 [Papilio xuthus]|uniref:Uncharacterized protein LOC106121150 isoform X1 n=2 Tax=Papilio xuthus TaxID=66420 RepID=A0AAJ7ECQ3_PAPXU|nr:PREDICTED: uncharacterized protein LOC106121150 isoform X1 [Papilio xuthus]